MISNFSIQVITQTRKNLLAIVDNLTLSELNKIPNGFNNNIIWNFGHIIVTLQLLCYKFANQDPIIPQYIIDKYKKGTRPTTIIEQEEINYLKSILFTSFENLEQDYNSGILNDYNSFTTSYHISIKNIEEAIEYTAVHDNIHFGYVQALKRTIIY